MINLGFILFNFFTNDLYKSMMRDKIGKGRPFASSLLGDYLKELHGQAT